ncbi:uncharacterized protein LOC130715702 isoform X3 [Lotus japonicus]|uniref:uncharacterized protein LOC130715702 isoform X3 n=1 Tax=Lotus japonicus TaxID=34305 RepID=UPI0025861D45|nr:uncharacterized protein LOC130715702 isoform X3 [Lotus japonicus]
MLISPFTSEFLTTNPALEPCSKKRSHHVHQHQMHKVHTLMNSCVVSPQRKRKLDQYMNNGTDVTKDSLLDEGPQALLTTSLPSPRASFEL